MTRTITRIATAALTAALCLGLAAGAQAAPDRTTAPDRTLEGRKTICTGFIDRRLTALDARQHELADAKHLTDADRSALNSNFDQTRSGLRALRDKVQGDTDVTTLRSDCNSVFTDYRVFALVLPRSRFVTVADSELYVAGRLEGAETKLQSAIDQAKANGKDVTQAQADLDAMKPKVASGKAGATGVPATLLALTPADWNANHDVLSPTRTKLRTARADLKDAAQLGHKVIADLKS